MRRSHIIQQETLFIISSRDNRTADSDLMKKSRLSREDAVCSIYPGAFEKGLNLKGDKSLKDLLMSAEV